MKKNNHRSTNALCTSIAIALGIITTPIVWAGATLDGSTGTGTYTGTYTGDMVIPDTDGTTSGSNLFHSFSDFNINLGESATFTGPDAINNVIARVTDVGDTTINGALNSAIVSANFYFINPNGIIFKEGASISVDGSFYATTSDYVRFSDDNKVYADTSTSGMTSAPPEAFGFLDSNPGGSITLEGTQLIKGFNLIQPDGATFSLVGGDIIIKELAADAPFSQLGGWEIPNSTGSFILANGNRFEVVSVASAGEAIPVAGDYDLSSFDTLGDVTISGGSIIDATDVYIRGGNIVISDAMIAPGYSSLLLGSPSPNGGSIDIAATEQVTITGTAPMQTFAAPYIARPDGGAYLPGITVFGGDPLPGMPPTDTADISISGGDVSISGVAAIISERLGAGVAGDITINGKLVEVLNGAFVANINLYDGVGGNITVNAEQVILDGQGDMSGLTGLNASSNFNTMFGFEGDAGFYAAFPTFNPFNPAFTSGNAGIITVNATGPGGLTVKNGASISTESRAFGQAGDIIITASDIYLSRDGKPFGTISSQSAYAGDSGDITITSTGNIDIQSGFEIAAGVQGTGNGGDITVTADGTITISGENSGIASVTTQPSAQTKDELAWRFGSADFDALIVDMNTFAGGPLLAADASMYDVLDAMQFFFGLINLNHPNAPTPAVAGNAGAITVTASALNMSDPSRITSSTTSDGNGGPINIQVDTLSMTSGAEIRSRSGLINPVTELLEVGAGNGGDIIITASNSITMDNGSISSSSLGDGLAGDIAIDAGDSLDMVNSSITTEATVSDGGNIQLMAIKRIYLDNSEITTSVENGTGAGGNIEIDPEFVILQQSNILANAFGGPGGNINLIADNFLASADSTVNASSALGLDGTVNISSPDEDVSKDLAELPDNYLDVSSLLSERCGTAAGASSLVNAGPDGLTVDPDGYLPSFVAANNYKETQKGETQSSSNKNWWTPYAKQPALQVAQVTCTF